MLHLVLSADRICLSDYLMAQVCRRAAEGIENQILVVPDQFSHETERRLCMAGGDTISRYAEVLSPSRLADRIFSSCGGAARSYLDHGGRLLAMALAAEQCASRIKLYGAMIRRPEFLVEMIAITDEFLSYGVSPAVLLAASEETEGLFAQKLEELGLLYSAYLAVCDTGSADPAEKLVRAGELLQSTDCADDRAFYFDGFMDFTGSELSIIEQVIRRCQDVFISLPADPEMGNVSNAAEDTLMRLKRLARKWGIPAEVIHPEQETCRDPALWMLLTHMFRNGNEMIPETADVSLGSFQTAEEECRHAVLQIKKRLASGVRCREIAVACTDMETYEAPLRAALLAADLPYYFAGRDPILNKPILNSILSALQAAVGMMDYEEVAVYLKSGLPMLEREKCDRLDHYAFIWNLIGSQWEKDWELHPRGFGELMTEDDRQTLTQLNLDKDVALRPLFDLRHELASAKNTGEMVLAVYHFLESIQLQKRLEADANMLGGKLGQELAQLYDILCTSLEQTWHILRDTVRRPDDFVKLYRTVLTQYRVGTIPAGLDQIYVGSLQDMRSKRIDHLLVLGANDGSFPAYQSSDGLLTEEERKVLLAKGLNLAPSRADQMDREISRIFSALSAAKKSLWLSTSGEQPAWLYLRAASIVPAAAASQDRDLFLNLSSFAAWRLRNGDTSPVDLPQLEQWENSLRQLRDYRFAPLEKETVEGLYGKKVYLSASRIDKFAACRFAFFLAYGLKAKPRRQAKMDPSAFGTFVHEVLEKTVTRVNLEDGFRQIAEERLLEIAMEEIACYAADHFPQQAGREAYLFRRSRDEILDIVRDLGEELRNSLFQPVSCELEFSPSGQLPPIEVEGRLASCKISGFVDRVDLYEKDGCSYVRVVDYKTGRKDFDYTDILNGAGLQMLIYLFALKQFGGDYYQKDSLIPAGVLYLPARKEYTVTPPVPDDSFVGQKHQEERRRRGLISCEPDVLSAMEEDPDHPRFMPYQVGKNGLKGNLATDAQMELLERHVLRSLASMTDGISSGQVLPNPIFRGQDSSCRFCDFQTVCHMDLCNREERIMAATSAEKFWEKLAEEVQNHG